MREMSVSAINFSLMAEITSLMGLRVPPRSRALLDRFAQTDDWVSSHRLNDIYEDLIQASGRTDLGLQLACNPAVARFGILPTLLMHTPQLGIALAHIQRFARLLQDESELTIIHEGQQVRVQVRPFGSTPSGKVCRTDFIMLGIAHVLRLFGKGRTGLLQVSFEHAEPTHSEQYRVFFDAPIQYSSAISELVFSSSMLDEALPGADPMLYSVMLQRANLALAERKSQSTVVDRVVQEIVQRMHVPPRMGDVAMAMGYTERTLRRHLKALGVDFQQLLVKLQAEHAQSLLIAGQRSIQQIAGDLGFNNTSAFHRAFRRWTGTTPKACQSGAMGSTTEDL